MRARAARDCARRRMRAHRHGRIELVVDLGLDRFHLSLVRPLGFTVGGRHLVHWHHVHYYVYFSRAGGLPGRGQPKRVAKEPPGVI